MSERGLIGMAMSQLISIIFPLTLTILSHKQLGVSFFSHAISYDPQFLMLLGYLNGMLP
jgi:hypothetical protein